MENERGREHNTVLRFTSFPVGRLKMMKKKLLYAFRGKNFLEEAGIFYFQLL
jgi:hypothetical protein